MTQKIAILIPTRERLPRFYKVMQSILNTTETFKDLYIYVGIDRDDPDVEHYLTYCRAHHVIPIVMETRLSVPMNMNRLGLRALADGADLLVIASDDVVFETQAWDTMVRAHYVTYPDKLMVGYFNNGRARELCEHFVVSKEWITALGYYVPTMFNHFYVDTWIAFIANRVDRLVWMRNIVLRHEHFKYGLSAYDSIYKRTRENNFSMLDMQIYEANRHQRIADSNKIRDAICA